MEIQIYIVLVALIVLGALFVIPRSNSKGKGNGKHPLGSGKTSRSYTRKEVSTHNTRKDCWIIIKDKEHPGGDAILNNAGDDSTEGFFWHKTWIRIPCLLEIQNSELDGEVLRIVFQSNEQSPQHGTRVFDIIEDFCIGELKG